MLRGHKVSWFLAMGLVGAIGSLAPACGGTDSNTSDATTSGGNRVCVPNDTKACLCAGGTMGVQTCNEAGAGFSVCDCGASSGSGGAGGAGSSGSSTGGGSSDPNCGNGVPDPGECGEVGTCQKDCGNCGNKMEDPGECGPGGTCPIDCDPCKDAVTYAGIVGPSGPIWTYGGLTGIDAGNEMCKKIGADHICTHAELKKADAHLVGGKSELASMPEGTTFWLHREDTDMVDVGGKMTPGGAGARCNDWKYGTNHISDGEFGDKTNGVINYHYDNDPVFDPNAGGVHVQPGVLDCGGQMRSITCCFSACVP